MHQDALYYGICLTCIDAPTCRNALNRHRPVLLCDGFDDGSTQSRDEESQSSKSSESADAHIEHYSPVVFSGLGLCEDCHHRNYCCLQNVPGGVWHCEMYV